MIEKDHLNFRLYTHQTTYISRTCFSDDLERFKSVQSGDIDKVEEYFIELRHQFMRGRLCLSTDHIRDLRYHMIICTALTARLCAEAGMPKDEAFTLSDLYIQKADELEESETIMDLWEQAVREFTLRMARRNKEKKISLPIRKCIEYIYDHLDLKLTINELAEYVSLNDSYLSKLFSSEMGIPVHSFIQNARIDTAKNILELTSYPYSEIASCLGFSSQSAFIAQFRKSTGITPKQYRSTHYNAEKAACKNT